MRQPSGDMIRVIAGQVYDHLIENEIAILDRDYNDEYRNVYVVATGEQLGEPIFPDTTGDAIWEWEEVSIVPTDDLRALKKASDSGNTTETARLAAYIVSSNNIK